MHALQLREQLPLGGARRFPWRRQLALARTRRAARPRRRIGNTKPLFTPAPPTGAAPPPAGGGAHSGLLPAPQRAAAERGAARLALVLDRRRRMGEGSAAGVAPGGRPRDRRLWKAGGEGSSGRPAHVAQLLKVSWRTVERALRKCRPIKDNL